MIKIAICDDDRLLAQSLEDMLSQMELGPISIDVFYRGDELLTYLEKSQDSFHLYLLDIELPGTDGMKVAASIRAFDSHCLILFVTSYQDYVYEVFDVLPFRFLRKPVANSELKAVMAAAVSHINRQSQLFFFQIGHTQHQLPYHEILYFEGAGRKVRLHSSQGMFEYYGKISSVMQGLDRSLFAQIHGSYVVNLEQVRVIAKDRVELEDGLTLPVSRKYLPGLHESHRSFLKLRGGV